MMRRTVRFSADSLVYSLRFSYWPDNSDLFSRAIDVGETQYFFPAPLRDFGPAVAPEDGETPRAYFRDFDPGESQARSATLYPIRNVLSAIHLVGREVGLDAGFLEARYSWTWIRAEHRESVRYAVRRVVGARKGRTHWRRVAK